MKFSQLRGRLSGLHSPSGALQLSAIRRVWPGGYTAVAKSRDLRLSDVSVGRRGERSAAPSRPASLDSLVHSCNVTAR